MHPNNVRCLVPPSLRVPAPGSYWLDQIRQTGLPMTELGGLPSDLSGWLAMVGISYLLRKGGPPLGFRPSEDLVYDAWKPVVAMDLSALTDKVRTAIGRGLNLEEGHFLKWYAGRQTAKGTIEVLQRLALDRDIGEDLAHPHSPDPSAPTFYWAGDSSIPPAYRSVRDSASAARPVIEWLAFLGLSSLRWDPVRFDRAEGVHVLFSLYPVEPASRWHRRAIRTPPRPVMGAFGERSRLEIWGCRAPKVDKYRRSASWASPVLLVDRSLRIGGR